MRNFLYRCPVTRLNVQGTIAKEEGGGGAYVSQSCPACGGTHLVDPLTGEGPKSHKADRIQPNYKLESRK